MKNTQHFLLCSIVLIEICLPANSNADDLLSSIKPYIASSTLYDTNFIRLPNGVNSFASTGKSSSSEIVDQLNFGLDMDWSIGRQNILVKANANQNWFQNFTSLNYLGWNNLAQWNWRANKVLNGQLAYSNRDYLGNFSQLNTLAPNELQTARYLANSTYKFHKRGRIKIGLFRDETQYLDPSRSSSAFSENNAELQLEYVNPYGPTVGLRYLATGGQYPNRQYINSSSSTLDNSYTRYHYELTYDWLVDSKLRIDGFIGYTQQKFPHLTNRDFSLPMGELKLHWQASKKVLVDLRVNRDIIQSFNANSSFFQTTTVEINPAWQILPKLSLVMPLSYQQQAYLGDPGGITVNTTKQVNDLEKVGLNLKYKPIDNITINNVFNYEIRQSNYANQGYQSLSVGINLKVEF